MLVHRGIINVDFAALRNVVRASGGTSVFGYGEGHGPERAEQAVQAAIASPLLDHGKALREAASVLATIVGGPDLTFRDVEHIMGAIQGAVRKDAHLIVGKAVDSRWQDQVAVVIVAAEQWAGGEAEPEPEEPAPPAAAESEPATGSTGRKTPKPRKRGKSTEGELFDGVPGKGLFKDVEATVLDGENLDIPTFIRRRVALPK
jgi:cell division protein FtsZ